AMSSHTFYKYCYFLSDVFHPRRSQKRNLLVLDEAHQLESEVGDFKSFTIRKNMLPFLKVQMPDRNLDDVVTWLDFCIELKERLFEFAEKAARVIERR